MRVRLTLLCPLILIVTFASILADDAMNQNLLRLQKEKKKLMTKEDVKRRCQRQGLCSELPADCLICNFNKSCVYGENVVTECQPVKGVVCEVMYNLVLCYVTDDWSACRESRCLT